MKARIGPGLSIFVPMIGSLVVMGISIALLTQTDSSRTSAGTETRIETDTLNLFCASSNRAVMEACVDDYQRRGGARVAIQYGASQTLLSTIQITKSADLFLPADASYLKQAEAMNLVSDCYWIASMEVIAVVRRGNPKSIKTFDDVLQDGVRFSQANPDAAAVGRLTRQRLITLDRWDEFRLATDTFHGSVSEVANDVLLGSADVGIVFDPMLVSYPMLEPIAMTELEGAVAQVSIGVIASSPNRDLAIDFANFLMSPEGGRAIYRRFGFHTDH